MTARERVASFLLAPSWRAGASGGIELPTGRLDIADHLGPTIETVSRTLTDLRRKGGIALPTSHRVLVLRPVAPRALAGETGDRGRGRRPAAARGVGRDNGRGRRRCSRGPGLRLRGAARGRPAARPPDPAGDHA